VYNACELNALLALYFRDDLRQEMYHACADQGLGRDAAFVVIAAQSPRRDTRGYRYGGPASLPPVSATEVERPRSEITAAGVQG